MISGQNTFDARVSLSFLRTAEPSEADNSATLVTEEPPEAGFSALLISFPPHCINDLHGTCAECGIPGGEKTESEGGKYDQ
jgi:hypothetical protein